MKPTFFSGTMLLSDFQFSVQSHSASHCIHSGERSVVPAALFCELNCEHRQDLSGPALERLSVDDTSSLIEAGLRIPSPSIQPLLQTSCM